MTAVLQPLPAEDETLEPRGDQYRLMTPSQAVDHWLSELERKGSSQRTIETYRGVLGKFTDALPPDIDVRDVTSPMIRHVLDRQARRADGRRKSAATLAQQVTVVCQLFDWLTWEDIIKRNPTQRNGQRIFARPKQLDPDANDNVTTVSSSDVAKLLAMVDEHDYQWNRRLAIYTLVYLGPRRRALAFARLSDYDRDSQPRTLTFREKGSKTITKPVPHILAELFERAIREGVYETADDYLIPGDTAQRNTGERSDRIIWRLVKAVADDCGVAVHVHALRAAFAVEYLETHPGQVESLKDLMGHRRLETTLVYLRRLDRKQKMETVCDLDWGRHGTGEIRTLEPVSTDHSLSRRAPSATRAPFQNELLSGIEMAGDCLLVGVEHEPSLGDFGSTMRPISDSEAVVPLDEALLERLPTTKEPIGR